MTEMLTGASIRGPQTAALVGATPVAWFPDADWLQVWLGHREEAERLAAQGLVLALILVSPANLRLAGRARE